MDRKDVIVTSTMASIGSPLDLADHFCISRHYHHKNTWLCPRERYLARCDYILVSDRRQWTKLEYKKPKSYISDHVLVVGHLIARTTLEHKKYARTRTTLLFHSPLQRRKLDADYDRICRMQEQPKPRDDRRVELITKHTWDLVDRRAALWQHCWTRADIATPLNNINVEIRRSLKRDRSKRAEDAGDRIEACLERDDRFGAWRILKAWYRNVTGRPHRPTEVDMEEATGQLRDLYDNRDAELPRSVCNDILIFPFNIRDAIPDEEEIRKAALKLRPKKSPGPSALKADTLRNWAMEYFQRYVRPIQYVCNVNLTREKEAALIEESRYHPLDFVVNIIIDIFTQTQLPHQLTLNSLVLIPKSNSNELRSIGLTDSMWKLCGKIISKRIGDAIEWHPSVHGFRTKHGTGTATLEVKLLSTLAETKGDTVFQVYLDPKNAFDTVSRSRLMELLEVYGVRTRLRGLIQAYWDTQQVALKQKDFYGEAFHPQSGVTQGDVLSPTLFNILVDFVVRQLDQNFETTNGISRVTTISIFYSDDGYIGGLDPCKVQFLTDEAVRLFKTLGLNTNVFKTKSMTCHPYIRSTSMTPLAYNRRWDEEIPTFKEQLKVMVACPTCKAQMIQGSLARHLRMQHNMSRTEIANMTGVGIEDKIEEIFISDMTVNCPKTNCPYVGPNNTTLRKHIRARHPQDKIYSFDMDLVQCPHCLLYLMGMEVPERHLQSQDCKIHAERNRRRILNLRHKQDLQHCFYIGNQDLATVHSFPYLGRIITSDNDDRPAVCSNLSKAKKKWGRIRTILKKETSSNKTMANFYKAVVQSVLLYGSETWALSDSDRTCLDTFHHQVARHLTHQHIRPDPLDPDKWILPNSSEVLASAGLKSISQYIEKRRSTLRNTARDSSRILPICLRVRKPRRLSWWML